MKRFTGLIIVAILLIAILSLYANHLGKIKARHQHDPVETVDAFMSAAAKISSLLWDQQARESLRSDLKAWKEGDDLPESLKQYGLQDPSLLFRDEKFGKAAFTTISLYHFDTYELRPTSAGKAKTVVQVTFVPYDFMGIRQTVSALGAPQQQAEPKPVDARFRLEKKWGAWYIVGVEGELSDAMRAFKGLR